MLGAVVGDILGSIHEKIPGKNLRQEYQLTDDSFLTLAALDWINNIDALKFQYLFESNKRFSSADYNRHENELRQLAEQSLIKWHDIGHNTNWQNTENAIPIFSPGFEAWAESIKQKTQSNIKHKGNTNGCLMRNSPIAFIGIQKELTLEQVLKLSEIFCIVTHNHFDSLNAVRIHSAILYSIYKNKISPGELKKQLAKSQKHFFNYPIEIKTLEHWIPTDEKIKNDPGSKFIWDAKTSLDIACSAIYYSNSFQDVMDFCNGTKMDTDTYAAIAGPIAAALWGIEASNLNIAAECIKKVPDAYNELVIYI
jgi:ADP-ribosylglycohydrolase